MNKAAFIRARIQPDLKVRAEHVLHILGITPTQAVTMLYSVVANHEEWPLELKVPNAETRKAFEETDKGVDLITSKNIDSLFDELGI